MTELDESSPFLARNCTWPGTLRPPTSLLPMHAGHRLLPAAHIRHRLSGEGACLAGHGLPPAAWSAGRRSADLTPTAFSAPCCVQDTKRRASFHVVSGEHARQGHAGDWRHHFGDFKRRHSFDGAWRHAAETPQPGRDRHLHVMRTGHGTYRAAAPQRRQWHAAAARDALLCAVELLMLLVGLLAAALPAPPDASRSLSAVTAATALAALGPALHLLVLVACPDWARRQRSVLWLSRLVAAPALAHAAQLLVSGSAAGLPQRLTAAAVLWRLAGAASNARWIRWLPCLAAAGFALWLAVLTTAADAALVAASRSALLACHVARPLLAYAAAGALDGAAQRGAQRLASVRSSRKPARALLPAAATAAAGAAVLAMNAVGPEGAGCAVFAACAVGLGLGSGHPSCLACLLAICIAALLSGILSLRALVSIALLLLLWLACALAVLCCGPAKLHMAPRGWFRK